MIRDKVLEKKILRKLLELEILNDSIGPTPLRHMLSELIVQTRLTLIKFNQADWEARLNKESDGDL